MIDHLMWIVTFVSVIGTIGNVYKKAWCFLLYASTNALWVAYDIQKGVYAQAGLMTVYFFLALWGLWRWRREEASETDKVEKGKG